MPPQITTNTKSNIGDSTVTKDNANNINAIKNQNNTNNRRDELVSEPTNTDVLCGRGGYYTIYKALYY